MDERLDPEFSKAGPQPVAIAHADHEEVPDRLGPGRDDGKDRIDVRQSAQVHRCNRTATLIPLIEQRKLDAQHRGLELIEPVRR